MLQAVAIGRKLAIFGEAARTGIFRVEAQYLSDEITVTDNNAGKTDVPVQGESGAVRHLDLSGLTGAGAYVFWNAPHGNSITGSAQGDYIYLYGQSNDTLRGGKGDDLLFGNEGNDVLRGDRGKDQLNGGGGDDRLTGGAGNDTIDGGAGTDTMVLSGARIEYDIKVVNGRHVITHARGTGRDGTDSFANVEFLQFSDQTVAVDSAPIRLQATAEGRTLIVSGDTARTGLSLIAVEYVSGEITVSDNDQVGTVIPVQGDISAIRHLDLSGLTGAGARVFWNAPHGNSVTGSVQGDYIYLYGQSNDTLRGGKGDDLLFGNEGDDVLRGDWGHDQINGGVGDDRLTGGAGNDSIDGGVGTDTMILSGARTEYDIEVVNGRHVITHARGTGRDGTDSFANVEFLQFSDQRVAIDSAPTNLQAIAGGQTLVVSGDAARTDVSRIAVEYVSGAITVTDNDGVETHIPIQGDTSSVRHLDLKGLTGAGARVFWDAPHGNSVTGSAEGDYIYLHGQSNDTLRGGKGDDLLFGNEGNDVLRGDRGADSLDGGAGDDRLTGGIGNDTIDGGDGVDTMIFLGPRADYDIEVVNGNRVISHSRGTGRDGVDTFANVEFLKFSDETVAVDDIFF